MTSAGPCREDWAELSSRLYVFCDAAKGLHASTDTEVQQQQLLQTADALVADGRAAVAAISGKERLASSLIVESKVGLHWHHKKEASCFDILALELSPLPLKAHESPPL